jgi:hypothetical protein
MEVLPPANIALPSAFIDAFGLLSVVAVSADVALEALKDCDAHEQLTCGTTLTTIEAVCAYEALAILPSTFDANTYDAVMDCVEYKDCVAYCVWKEALAHEEETEGVMLSTTLAVRAYDAVIELVEYKDCVA